LSKLIYKSVVYITFGYKTKQGLLIYLTSEIHALIMTCTVQQ